MSADDVLDRRIRQLVAELADTAPAPDWATRESVDPPARSKRRSRALLAAGAGAAVAVAVLVLLLAAGDPGSEHLETADSGDAASMAPAASPVPTPQPPISTADHTPATIADGDGTVLFEWDQEWPAGTAPSELAALIATEAAGLPALGATAEERIGKLASAGLTIRVTIDPGVESITERSFALLPPELEAVSVTIDKRTGDILAAASRSGQSLDQAQASTAARLAIMAAALEDGLDPDATIDGTAPCTITMDGTSYEVTDFGGASGFEGNLAEQTYAHSRCALARFEASLGIGTAAATLDSLTGTQRTSASPQVVDPPQLTALQQARMVATITNGGLDVTPGVIAEITDASGSVIYRREASRQRLLSSDTARAVTEIMEGNVREGTGTSVRIDGVDTAGITGTMDDFTVAWFVGTTGDLTTAIWVARPDGAPMEQVGVYGAVTGSTYPAQLYRVTHAAILSPDTAEFPTYSANDPAPSDSGDGADPGSDAPPADVTIDVVPSTVPEPGTYTFSIHGTGWTNSAPVFVAPCADESLSTCDIERLTPATPSADGTFDITVSYTVDAGGLTINAADAPGITIATAVVTVAP
ncbi:MAG: hypothetical protein KDB21_03200 [Acidimicrobiales bacterium]|nr:hypothetical protein [Acidimicrobiales bacterium]